MRNALPVITEDAATLKQRLQHEHDGRKQSRLQKFYLLASGQAQTRQDVAQLLGIHRHTIGHWLARYATGGLETLLDLYVPAGKPLSLPQTSWPPWSRRSGNSPALPLLKRCGSGSSRPVTWTSTTPPSTRSSAPSSRCRGPVTQKHPEAIEECQATCREQLQRVIPPVHTRPVRVFSQQVACIDEDGRVEWLGLFELRPASPGQGMSDARHSRQGR